MPQKSIPIGIKDFKELIQLSLKSAKQPTWALSFLMLKRQLAMEFKRHNYVAGTLDSDNQDRFYKIQRGRRSG